jgi:pimeloyl-ACP methyl ester carboxylesterase
MLAFERAGQGIPLVFVHAFPLSRKMWDGVKPAFSKNFQFICVDLPGFGETPLSSDTSTMEFMAREIVATLDAIGVKDKFVATGVSMGGYVLMQLVRLFPERLRGMVLVSTRSAADTPEGRQKRFQTIQMVEKSGTGPLAEKMMPQLFGKTSLTAQLPVINEVKGWIQQASPKAVCAALRVWPNGPIRLLYCIKLRFPRWFYRVRKTSSSKPPKWKLWPKVFPISNFMRLKGRVICFPMKNRTYLPIISFILKCVAVATIFNSVPSITSKIA